MIPELRGAVLQKRDASPPRRKSEPPRGMLHTETAAPEQIRHVRYHPSPELGSCVEHYWSVEWDRRGLEPERVQTLPHPSVHMVFERRAGARVVGVTRGRFTRLLRDDGGVFGVKFRPGGFQAFLGGPVSRLTDRRVPLREVFGPDGVALARAILAEPTDATRIALVEAFLVRRVPPAPDEVAIRVSRLVYAVMSDRRVAKVDDLVARSGLNKRMLQRLFAKYVGVSPKWVIQRYRLHEAAERLVGDDAIRQVELAQELGYSDQAHFVRDFKSVTGMSPAAYRRKALASPDGSDAHQRDR